jgi:hypothetical protein
MTHERATRQGLAVGVTDKVNRFACGLVHDPGDDIGEILERLAMFSRDRPYCAGNFIIVGTEWAGVWNVADDRAQDDRREPGHVQPGCEIIAVRARAAERGEQYHARALTVALGNISYLIDHGIMPFLSVGLRENHAGPRVPLQSRFHGWTVI